jgi:hypothetical protein
MAVSSHVALQPREVNGGGGSNIEVILSERGGAVMDVFEVPMKPSLLGIGMGPQLKIALGVVTGEAKLALETWTSAKAGAKQGIGKEQVRDPEPESP